MRFYTKQHLYYCGIDLHARSMYVCILDQDGEIVLHRNMLCTPQSFIKAIAPYRDNVAVAVECIFTWDRCRHLIEDFFLNGVFCP